MQTRRPPIPILAALIPLLLAFALSPGCADDATRPADTSPADTSPTDTSTPDSAPPDAGVDSSVPDSSVTDATPMDAAADAIADTSPADTGPADAIVDSATADVPGAGTCGASVEALLGSDRVLSLTGTATLTLPPGPCILSRVCVSDSAALFVDGTSALEITGDAPSVITGAGVGSIDTSLARLEVALTGTADFYIVVENATAPFELDLDAPTHSVTILITGAAGLTVSGVADTVAYGGDPTGFPSCP